MTSINYNYNNHRRKSQVEIETMHFQTFPSKYVLVILSFLSFVLFNNGLSHIGLTPARKKKTFRLNFFDFFD